eukprot:CCRYP_011170-RC/>CCRYP_011170-RC protein AED:0.44 eAED:1.00 QI:0/0/0/1/0/0/2/0/121
MLLNRFLNILAPTNHTGSRPTKLNKVLPHLGPIEHGVERSHLVHAGGVHLNNLSHLVHGRDREPSSVLTLSEIEEGDDAGLFVVGGIFGEDFVDTLVLLEKARIQGKRRPPYREAGNQQTH